MQLTKRDPWRPTKYDPSFVQKIEEYLQTVGREQTKLPKRVDIALLLGVNEDTLNNWAKVYPNFLGALTRVDNYQKSQLMDDGMYGGKEVNPNVAIFLLKANHGLIETSRTEVTGAYGEPFSVAILGRGFIPPSTVVDVIPEDSDRRPAQIQSNGVASEK